MLKKVIALCNHGRHFGDLMSSGNQGVFQLRNEAIFEEFWYFAVQENGVILGIFYLLLGALLIG